jgi:hypothetical protein
MINKLPIGQVFSPYLRLTVPITHDKSSTLTSIYVLLIPERQKTQSGKHLESNRLPEIGEKWIERRLYCVSSVLFGNERTAKRSSCNVVVA